MIHRLAVAVTGKMVAVVGRETDDYESLLDLPDLGGGPAVGLLSALRHAGGDVFLVAVDQPLLRPSTVQSLLEIEGDVVVPLADGHPQVTCALYRAVCRAPFEQAITGGERKLRRLLAR